MTTLQLMQIRGPDIEPWVSALVELRADVYRDYPYLYDGPREHQQQYLATCAATEHSLVVCALDEGKVIGAAVGLPIAHEVPDFQRPFILRGLDPARYYYCGEPVIRPEYRGRGLYHLFFSAQERQARRLGSDFSLFCTVQRPEDHPLRPAGYAPLDEVWHRLGYEMHPQLRTKYRWKDIDEDRASVKSMVYWLKPVRN